MTKTMMISAISKCILNLKRQTSGGNFLRKTRAALNMKNHLFCMLVFALIVSMPLISCKSDIDVNETGKNADLYIFVVDISEETDWNYIVVGQDGSSIFFNVDESNNIPTDLFLRPDKNSDNGFTILFKENGLPDKMITNGHILYFGNFNGYKFDLAIINPDDTIQYFYDIETDINWAAYNEVFLSGRGRFLDLNGIMKSLSFVSHAIGISTCVVSVFFPPALGGCAAYVASEVGNIVIDQIFDGFTADVGHAIINVIGCAGGGIAGAVDCISGLAGAASLLAYLDFNLAEQKTTEINEAIRRIDGDGLTVIPPDLLEDLLRLGIEINHGRNPPDIEGTYLSSPTVLVRSNFADSYSPGYQFNDLRLTFSNQDNARMTVDVSSTQGDSVLSGVNSFITGDGSKFSVFSDMTNTTNSSRSVYIYSGEITSSGIRNHYRALIITVEGPNTIKRGQGRLIYDSDGFSERVTSGRSLSVIQEQSMNGTSFKELLPETYSSGY